MSTVWGFGTSAIDIRLKTAEYGEGYKDKLLAQETMMIGGGSTSNFLVQVSKLGFKAGWLGKLGNDFIGSKIINMLSADKIDCSHVIFDDRVISPFNVAVYAGDHKRRIGGFLLPNSMTQINDSELEELASAIVEDDFVLVEVGEIPLATCVSFCELVKLRKAKIIIDVDLDPIKQCGSDKETTNKLFDLADYLMPNITSLATMYPDANKLEITKYLAKKHNCITITTLGSEGAAYSEFGEDTVTVPGIKVTPIDTVGAGDSFHGGFAAGLCAGMTTEKAIALGNVCGGHICLTFGIRDGMLKAEELYKYNICI